MKSKIFSTFCLCLIIYSCSSDSNTASSDNRNYSNTSVVSEKDPYEMMHIAFEGSPEISTIKPMIESIMDRYNMSKTNDNILKVGNMLVSLRQSSAVGVTEMELLKHIYQHGSDQITLGEQAGISATLLEISK